MVALQATEYAKQHTRDAGFLSVYSHGNLKAKKENPFEHPAPYVMDNAQFVFWCFHNAGVTLSGDAEGVNVQTIRRDPRFKVISSEGQKHKGLLNSLEIGDLLFFGTDTTHVALFAGACDIISMNGSGDWDASKGIQISDITADYWWSAFNGAVLRWV